VKTNPNGARPDAENVQRLEDDPVTWPVLRVLRFLLFDVFLFPDETNDMHPLKA
jgi:hypothetical protein